MISGTKPGKKKKKKKKKRYKRVEAEKLRYSMFEKSVF